MSAKQGTPDTDQPKKDPLGAKVKNNQAADKQARLSQALRDNLFKRKAQARARTAAQAQSDKD
ncbi:MAG: hypothetical protein ACON4G_05130 [Candidatus Puniceispirillaceae bacterium]